MNNNFGKVQYIRLAYQPQDDGSKELTVVSYNVWKDIIDKNKGKTGYERRYFTKEYHHDGNHTYCLLCEVSWEEYREWDAQNKASKRNENNAEPYSFLSLDAPVYHDDNGDSLLNGDIIAAPHVSVEDDGEWNILLDGLRKELAAWKPWAEELLYYYWVGMGRKCTPILARKYNLTEADIRYRKRLFKNRVKAYCAKNGIAILD